MLSITRVSVSLSLLATAALMSACQDEVPGYCGVFANDIATRVDAERVCEVMVHSLEVENCVDVLGFDRLSETTENFCDRVVTPERGTTRFGFNLQTECAILSCDRSEELTPSEQASEQPYDQAVSLWENQVLPAVEAEFDLRSFGLEILHDGLPVIPAQLSNP
jgi:hypothetical protein